MNRKQAYTLLELTEDATQEEIKEKYQKQKKKLTDPSQYKKLTKAYQLLLSNQNNNDKTLNKLKDFLYFYKYWIIAVLVIGLLIGSFTYTMIGQYIEEKKLEELPPSELNIFFIGDYENEDFTPFKNNLRTFSDFKRVQISYIFAEEEAASDYNIGVGMSNPALTQLTPDIFIIDANFFPVFAKQGAFMPLNELSPSIIGNINDDRYYFSKTDWDESEQLYGIDITDSSIFEQTHLKGKKILAIQHGTTRIDNAKTFIQIALDNLSK